MKRMLTLFVLTAFCLLLCACGDVSNVKITPVESNIFSQEDITAAENTIINEFKMNWSGCTLKELRYAGDGWSKEFQDLEIFYDADEAIVLLSSIDVNEDTPTDKAGTTLQDFNWILVRNKGGQWEHKDHGY